MRVLKTDDNEDIVVVDGDFVWIEGTDAITQMIKTRLKTFRGEVYLDTSIGVPYHQKIFKKGVNLITIGNELKREVRKVPGVIEVTTLNFDYVGANRELTANMTIKTDEGDIDLEEILI